MVSDQKALRRNPMSSRLFRYAFLGLAKRGGNLPPGLEKQLERNGTLPPGLQKRLQPCPIEIERQLVPLAPDYRRGFIGAHLVVFNRNTGIIVDVRHDVY